MLRKLWARTPAYFLQPFHLIRNYKHTDLRPDLVAGLTVAIVLLPQAIAYAMLAELPPNMGLYAAIVTAVIGALWGSSHHLSIGPTNTSSLVVLATLLPIAEVGSRQYILAAGLMAVMVGVFQVVLGVARMGVLVNFVSDSVIIGLTAGAGVLIGANQLRHLLRLDYPSSSSLITTLREINTHIGETHWGSLILGLLVMLVIILIKRYKPHWPGLLIGMIFATALVSLLHLDHWGVAVIGQLPRSLPPVSNLPLLDFELLSQLSAGALAVGMMSLVEAVAISRSIASQSGQHLDSNQEFIGLGLSNLVSGFFSGYSVSGSFTRSVVKYDAGARTSISSIFAGLFVLIAMLIIAPLAANLPRTALAGVLLVTAYGMIDRKEIVRIWRGTSGDAAIMVVTFLATLFLPLQFAVLTGILISFAVYIMRTSVPRVVPVVPAKNFSHFSHQPDTQYCPQLAILDIFGDLYFGATSHIEEAIREHLDKHPTQRFLLLRMFSVNQIDISGVHALESIVRMLRQRAGDIFLMRTQGPVLDLFKSTGFYDLLGEDHFLSYGDAIEYLFNRILDPAVCIYECDARVFMECQNLPRPIHQIEGIPLQLGIPPRNSPGITPLDLWRELHGKNPPVVVDIREPREFLRGHIPQAESIPIFKLLTDPSQIPQIRQVVLVCRSGRRSRRAAHFLQQKGFLNIRALEGGILAWENEGLLEALDEYKAAI